MPVGTKSVYDPERRADGVRLLVTRYWPRGMRKSVADRWERRVAPSAPLVKAFKREGLPWADYRKRYLAEMESAEAREALREIAALAGRGPVTLLCICREEARCHRGLLRSLLGGASDLIARL